MAADRKTLALPLADAESDAKRNRILSLSDLALEGLASPAQNTGKTPSMTPTPTQFLFPKSVTAEQEDFTSGFARALEQIYRSQGKPALAGSQPDGACGYTVAEASGSSEMLMSTSRHNGLVPSSREFHVTENVPCFGLSNTVGGPIACGLEPPAWRIGGHSSSQSASFDQLVPCVAQPSTSLRFSTSGATGSRDVTLSSSFGYQSSVAATSSNHTRPSDTVSGQPPTTSFMSLADLPSTSATTTNAAGGGKTTQKAETVQPCPSSTTTLPPKVDLAEQDQWRLERKRAKNRVAAARCQMRKIERITKLQEKVQLLRTHNARLADNVVALRDSVGLLRRQIMMHTELGCRLLVPPVSYA